MAWSKTSEGGATKKYAVYSCDLYPVIAATGVSEHNWTPVIDFIPPGCDFTVIANAAAANLSASSGVELFVGYSNDDTAPTSGCTMTRYIDRKTPFVSDTSQIDAATKVLFRNVSTYGQYPYYWLKMPGGGFSGAAVTFKVIVGGRSAIVTEQ